MAKALFSLERQKPQVMAIINTTPDSFSDGGQYYQQQRLNLDKCLRRVDEVIEQGASIIDIGGESTRPGAQAISVQQEMDRVLPLLEKIRHYDVVLSLDSSTPALMQQAAKLGIGLLNDIRALQRQGALEMAAQLQLPVCIMHMLGEPQTMQQNPQYKDVISDIAAFFEQRILACEKAGLSKQQLLLDPGFGFGKTLQHNCALLNRLHEFEQFAMPLLVGLSRKAMIGQILQGRAVNHRVSGSIALALLAMQQGAWIFRVHDVKETVDALQVAYFIQQERGNE